MAVAIDQLRREWNAQTGASFQVEQVWRLDYQAGRAPDADAVILPPCDVAELADSGWLVPMPKPLIRSAGHRELGDPDTERPIQEPGNWPDLFPLLRAREAVWGDRVVGVPLGSPMLVCYCRADLLERLGAKPPRTWAEYGKLARKLADSRRSGWPVRPEKGPWYGALEPLGPGWAGIVLLARAAPYAVHPAHYSALFRIDTMEPLIDGPPFVRALEELVFAVSVGPDPQPRYDPAEVRRAFWNGQCGLALTWPSPVDRGLKPAGPDIQVELVELPGSTEVYNISSRAWEGCREGARHVPLLGVAGRMGTVTVSSQWPEWSFRLLLWLSDEQWSRLVSGASPATTLFRQSDLGVPQNWVEGAMPPDAADQYAALAQRGFQAEQWLFALRIPGRTEYLRALDAAVWDAVQRKATPKEALARAAAEWRKITQARGLERQQAAYLHGLGLR
ncbi:MAG: extracellular solute-binding protein [Thermoguttaceae bacterium]